MARSPRASGPSTKKRKPRGQASNAAPVAWGALGFLLAAGVTTAVWMGCQRELPPGETPEPPTSAPAPVASAPRPPEPAPSDPVPFEGEDEAIVDEEEQAELADAGVADAAPNEEHLAGAIVPQASVFANMEWAADKRIGYVRMAGKIAVDPTPVKAANCTAGWYRVLTGGYVCGRHVTLNLNHASVRLGRLPNVEDLLPYQYAWNGTMGTPLYRSVPSKDEMLKYEPYLVKPKKKASEVAEAPKPLEGESQVVEVAAKTEKADADADKKPWWQAKAENAKAEVKLADLTQGSDAVLARRLVKGFFVAVERTFSWNGRHWHKTTEGLVTPADRFTITKAPTFQGVELAGTDTTQAVGFILSTKARKYEITLVNDKPKLKAGDKVERHSSLRLTGQTQTIAGELYRETTEGWWMKNKEGTYTEPGPMPANLQPGEKWIDVNLARQTLVAFEGETPVFATLVSTGRRLPTHQTPKGMWRIREKHISTRMSGDGVSPGENPYSIDDVPYVMYYEGSYALHTAFWHSDYGRVRSHGCTNLSPLDAKRVFNWADPPLPTGWHGVYATKETPGTLVVVHD